MASRKRGETREGKGVQEITETGPKWEIIPDHRALYKTESTQGSPTLTSLTPVYARRRVTAPRFHLLLLLWLAVMVGLASSARAQDGITLRIDALPDTLTSVSPASLFAGAHDAQFAPFAEPFAPGFGPPVWLRLTLPPGVDPSGERILELRTPYVNRFDIYHRSRDGTLKHSVAGNMVKRTADVVDYQYAALRVQLSADPGPIYVRMDTRTTRLVTALLWRPTPFGLQGRDRYLTQGLLFGMFVAVGLVYLVLGSRARGSGYVVYAAYVLASAWINAVAQGLVDPLPPPLYNPVVGLGACLMVGLGAELVRIARPDRHYPRLLCAYRRVCWTLAACLAPLAIAGLYNIVSPISQLIFVLQAGIGCAVGAMLWRLGEPAGKTFFLGFLVMNLALLAFVLQNLGLTPLLPWAPVSMVLGALAHVAMMSIAVAQRMQRLGRQREVAQLALLESLRHSEQRLEQRVEERTSALRREMRRRQAAETELRAANLRTEQALMAEREANQRQRDFFLMMSHDLRTPLSVLDATIGASARGQATDETRQARARRAVTQLQNLVDTSLAADTFDALEPDFNLTHVELAPLVAEVVRRTEDLDGTPHIQTDIATHCVVHGDALWLRILLTNLLHNAVHHTPNGTQIRVCARSHGDVVTVTVEDDGPGMSADELGALGRRFQRPAHSERTGSGIGLYAVREIVERHQGDVSFDTSPMGGLRVNITLPCPVPAPAHGT